MKRTGLLVALLVTMAACSKDTLNPNSLLVGMGGDTWERTELDDWLYQEFVEPYNIDVKYKWDPYEVNQRYNYTPVKEEKVKELMAAIKKVWIEPYEKLGGPEIIKKMSPKRYVLVGSFEYTESTQTNGTAEGTNKITLFNVNGFDVKNSDQIRGRMKTVHHEYGHTLSANMLYPDEWKTICSESYSGQWSSLGDGEAQAAGFVSQYARANPEEDWAETLSTILVYGRGWFDARVALAGTDGGEKLRKKEAIVLSYFKTNWGIDLYETYSGGKNGLMDTVQEAIEQLMEEN
ncbi:MAG: putative zinc-binding metallopeptidase [Prevotellaceae bacterium]|jgi:substrate import-associated zinc metallohydrolase lipoprotein|nr:putative zinc-binding metallopeptidase [Prevotellaceae bacterium]